MSDGLQGMGGDRKRRLRQVLREVVAGGASEILLKRLEAVLESADGDSLHAASDRMTKMVALFVGKNEAKRLTERFRPILDED